MRILPVSILGLLSGLLWLGIVSCYLGLCLHALLQPGWRSLAPSRAGMGRRVPYSLCVFLALGLILTPIIFLARRELAAGPGLALGPGDWVPTWFPLAMLVGPPVFGVWWFWRVCLRYSDRDVNRTHRRALVGDVEGAVEELRQVIQVKGPSANRLNGLGCLLGMQGMWQDAYKAFLAAEELGAPPPRLQTNKAVAAWKLGRVEEAEEMMAGICASHPSDINAAFQHCHVLEELGRLDEARGELTRAEEIARNTIAASSVLVEMNRVLEEARQRLGPGTEPARGEEPKEPILDLDDLL